MQDKPNQATLTEAIPRADESQRPDPKPRLRLRTSLRAGGHWLPNHTQRLRVRTNLRAGGKWLPNHSQSLRVRTSVRAGTYGAAPE